MVFSGVPLSELDQIEMEPHGKHQLSYKKRIIKITSPIRKLYEVTNIQTKYRRIENLCLFWSRLIINPSFYIKYRQTPFDHIQIYQFVKFRRAIKAFEKLFTSKWGSKESSSLLITVITQMILQFYNNTYKIPSQNTYNLWLFQIKFHIA